MQKVIATGNLTPKLEWLSWHNPLSYIKQVVELHPLWEVTRNEISLHYEAKKTTLLVIKNTSGVLGYDPYVMIWLQGTATHIAPCKNYDSSKEWYEQEATLNNNGNYASLSVGGGNINAHTVGSKITSVILNDYSIAFSFSNIQDININNDNDYNRFTNYLKFEIFDALDTNTSGMLIKTKTKHYIYANDIWFGENWNNIYSRESKIDIDKPVGTYHKPNAQGGFNATKRTLYINIIEDESATPIWSYIGKSFVFYAYAESSDFISLDQPDVSFNPITFYIAEGIFVRTVCDGNEKNYFISALDHQVNEDSIVETPYLVETYNRLQSDFFANPLLYPYYWDLSNSINEKDGRATSTEDTDYYHLLEEAQPDGNEYEHTIHFTATRNNSDSSCMIVRYDTNYYDGFYLKDGNNGAYISDYSGNQLSNEFTYDVGDTRTITISSSRQDDTIITYVDGQNVTKSGAYSAHYVYHFYLKKDFGSFSKVRYFERPLLEEEVIRLQNDNQVQSSLYTV